MKRIKKYENVEKKHAHFFKGVKKSGVFFIGVPIES